MQRLFEFSVLQGKLLKWEIAMFERSYLACTLAFFFSQQAFYSAESLSTRCRIAGLLHALNFRL